MMSRWKFKEIYGSLWTILDIRDIMASVRLLLFLFNYYDISHLVLSQLLTPWLLCWLPIDILIMFTRKLGLSNDWMDITLMIQIYFVSNTSRKCLNTVFLDYYCNTRIREWSSEQSNELVS